ncbi:MAG: SCO family protein [Terricaulis sp.]
MADTPKRRPWLFLAGAAAFAVLAVVAGVTLMKPRAADAANAAYASLGHGINDVQIVDDNGQAIRWSQLNGKPRALFFGFTHCPVICPVTVWQLNDAMDRIGPAAKDLQIEFVTLDSARDTPAVLHQYFGGFEGHVRGFSGDAAQIDRIAHAYEVVYRRVPGEGHDYTLDHTATVFLIDSSGQVVDVIGFGSTREVTEQRLRALVGAAAS